MAKKDYREQLLIGTNIGMALLFILALIKCMQAWHVDWQLTHKIVTPLSMTTINQQTALIDALPELHLFGKPIQAVSEVPVSHLELRVTGIAKQAAPKMSNAYISISNQPSKIFHVDDTVSSGVRLHGITKEAVVLDNHGKLEKLPLQRNKLEFKPIPTKERP